MLLGYARVSSDDQNLDLQLDALDKFGCERIFQEKITSAKETRPEFSKLISHLRPGDTIVVWRLDRLGRSTKELISIVEGFHLNEVKFVSLSEQLDTTSASGKLIFQVFAAFAEFERNLIRERTKAGLAASRARGRKGGGKTKFSDRQITSAKHITQTSNETITKICKELGISRATYYRRIKELCL